MTKKNHNRVSGTATINRETGIGFWLFYGCTAALVICTCINVIIKETHLSKNIRCIRNVSHHMREEVLEIIM